MIAFAIVLVIIGAVLLAIASPRKGGNIEIGTSDIKTNLPEITGIAKIPAFILGLALIGVGLWMGILLFVKSVEEADKNEIVNIPTKEETAISQLSTDTPVSLTSTPPPILSTPTAVPGREKTVSRQEIDSWTIGETSIEEVEKCLTTAHSGPRPFYSFKQGTTIPSNALVASNFMEGGVSWTQLPVKQICTYESWGLFESTGAFQAPYEGAYWLIVP